MLHDRFLLLIVASASSFVANNLLNRSLVMPRLSTKLIVAKPPAILMIRTSQVRQLFSTMKALLPCLKVLSIVFLVLHTVSLAVSIIDEKMRTGKTNK